MSHRSALLGVLFLCGCGDQDGRPRSVDARIALPDGGGGGQPDGPSIDSGLQGTYAQGLLDGEAFELRHAVVLWKDPFDELCVAQLPVAGPDCGYSSGEYNLILRGRIEIIPGTTGEWVFPVELRKLGTTQLEPGYSGFLNVQTYDPVENHFAATFEVQFDSGITAGHATVP